MKDNIKSIIEDYIEYIEIDDWETVFRKWYVDTSLNPAHRVKPEWSEILTGDETIKEFFSALDQAGIEDVEKNTLQIRKNIIYEKVDQTIDRILRSWDSVTFTGLKTHMNTFLGIKESYIRNIFSKLCLAKGLKPVKENSKSEYHK